MKRYLPIVILAILLCSPFLSCWKPVEGFDFFSEEGKNLRYYVKAAGRYPDVSGLKEGVIRFSGGGVETYSYKIRKPVSLTGAASLFSLEYISEAKSVSITLHYEDEKNDETQNQGETRRLPSLSGYRVECLLPVRKDVGITGFTLSSLDAGVFMLAGSSFQTSSKAVVFGDGKITIRAGLDVELKEEAGFDKTSIIFTDSYFKDYPSFGGVSLAYESSEISAFSLLTEAEGGGREFAVTTLAVPGIVPIPKAFTGESLNAVSVRTPTVRPSITESTAAKPVIRSVSLFEDIGPEGPIPADFGIVMYYPQNLWRNEDYELFSWSVRPDVLVFDTRNYAVQGDMFTRLAFFVEKKGFRGRVLTDAELKGKYGWNAHDYKPEDLAAFYNLAAKNGVSLNAKEEELKAVLVNNGVLLDSGEGFKPGAGAVLSVSRESPAYLRERFLIHEGAHGLWFVSPEYRAETEAIWRSLPQNVQSLWRRLLSRMSYDPEDEALSVNEFQAYSMQQPVAAINRYMRRHSAFSGTDLGNADFAEGAARVSGVVLRLFGFEAGTGLFVTPSR